MINRKRKPVLMLMLLELCLCGILLFPFARAEDPGLWILTQYPDQSGNQGMCYSLADPASGDLILIDGGWTANADQVRAVIRAHGDRVRAWFLTHYHADHIGAFNALYGEYRDRIGAVYVTPLPWEDFIAAVKSYDTPESFEAFLRLTEGDEKVIPLSRGAEFDLGIFHVQNFNAYDETAVKAKDIPNNCSLVLKFSAGSRSVLFCGDAHGSKMSKELIRRFGDRLKADLVQPGHHGNHSLTQVFYEHVNPKVMMFDAPEWLMAGDSYTAKDLKAWCDARGIRVFDYSTAPNVFTEHGLSGLSSR